MAGKGRKPPERIAFQPSCRSRKQGGNNDWYAVGPIILEPCPAVVVVMDYDRVAEGWNGF